MKKIYTLIILAFILNSCETQLRPTPGLEEFDVFALKSTVNTGEEVIFSFKGNPDIIYFYSDEVYNQYEYREGRKVGVESIEFSFETANPTKTSAQPNQFSIMITTNYTSRGDDYQDILAADWLDISEHFTFATTGTYVFSETLDLLNVIGEDETFHIGLKYVSDLEEGRPRRWRFRAPLVVATTDDGNEIMFGQGNSIFRQVFQYPDNPTNSNLNNSWIQFEAVEEGEINQTEEWAISMPFESGDLDFGPDRAIGVKGLGSDLTDFAHTYEHPGEYNVKFFAKNITINSEVEVMRELTITVVEPE